MMNATSALQVNRLVLIAEKCKSLPGLHEIARLMYSAAVLDSFLNGVQCALYFFVFVR